MSDPWDFISICREITTDMQERLVPCAYCRAWILEDDPCPRCGEWPKSWTAS